MYSAAHQKKAETTVQLILGHYTSAIWACGLLPKSNIAPIAARRSVHVKPDDTAASIWRGSLAPLGIDLFREVILKIEQGEIPSTEQEDWAATWEPALGPKKTAP